MVEAAPALPLTSQCRHYTSLAEVPKQIQKYWKNRYDIFSNYDDGIYLTDDAWFGVTPEPVATIADDLPSMFPLDGEATVVDMFAGAGGNTIAFALSGRWRRVIGIERDADTLACAQANAAASGVPAGAITWVLGDCFAVLPALLSHGGHGDGDDDRGSHSADQRPPSGRHKKKTRSKTRAGDAASSATACRTTASRGPSRRRRTPPDSSFHAIPPLDPRATVLFASPPWGGVGYTAQPVFDLAAMQPYNLQALHAACTPLPHALYLPRTSDLQQLADVAPRRRQRGRQRGEAGSGSAPADAADSKIDVVQYCMRGFSKALVAYYPSAFSA